MFHVVLRQSGPEFDPARPLDEQIGWQEHAEYVDALVADGSIVLGGPLPHGRVAHAMQAESEEELRAIWARDPWHESHLLLESIEPWEIRLDSRQLSDELRTHRRSKPGHQRGEGVEMTSSATERQRILGTLRVENGVGVVRIEDRLDAPIDEVWSALTDPARLAHWYGEVEGDLRLGGEFRARVFASGWEGTGRISECEPPHHFTTVSREPGRDESIHQVTLTADGDRTVVVYENLTVPADLLWAYGVGEQIHVEDLCAHLAGLARNDESRWEELEPAYRELAAKVA